MEGRNKKNTKKKPPKKTSTRPKPARKHICASKAGKSASKQASKQVSKQAGYKASLQAIRQASKHHTKTKKQKQKQAQPKNQSQTWEDAFDANVWDVRVAAALYAQAKAAITALEQDAIMVCREFGRWHGGRTCAFKQAHTSIDTWECKRD